MKKVMTIILCALVFQTTLASNTIVGPVKVKVANNEQATVDLSNTDVNRLFVENDKITSFNWPKDRCDPHNDPSGSVYFNVYGKSPFTAFVSTEKGRHFSLVIIPKSEPGATLMFIPTTPAVIHYSAHSALASAFEKSNPYEKTLITLLRGVMLREIPEGYTAISEKAFPTIAAFKIENISGNLNDLNQKVVAGFLGGTLALRVIKVTNTSHESVMLLARDFYSPSVRAVAIGTESLSGGESGYVYEVVSND